MTALCIALNTAISAEETVKNLRVVWSTHPTEEAVIVWDSITPDSSAKVLYDTHSHADEKTAYRFHAAISEAGLYDEVPASKRKNGVRGRTFDHGPRFYYHHVPLKKLTPGTVYYLAVKTSSGITKEYHFKTAPIADGSFKLIYAGDSRSRIDIAEKISSQISEMIREDDSIIALHHGGDYAFTTRRKLWKKWLEAYDLTTTADGKLLPIIPIIGNHDIHGKSPLFRQAYGYPGGDRDYFTCHLTPQVTLICLNTEISAEGKQRSFLEAELFSMKTKNTRWQIASYHSPAFPAIKQPSSARISWVPLFDKYNLDLVLESDGHCIKRTVPIRNGEEDPSGTVYLGEGGYGAPQRNPKTDRWYLQGENAFASKGDHIMILEFTPLQINYSTLLLSGETVDSMSFKARR